MTGSVRILPLLLGLLLLQEVQVAQPMLLRSWLGRGRRRPSGNSDSADGRPVKSKCPGWLSSYAEFHRQTRGAPNATYLVYSCALPGEHCAGIGDRLKGILFLLRLAAQYKKVLLIDWETPGALTTYLAPNQIDWTFNGLDSVREAIDTGKRDKRFDLGRNQKIKDYPDMLSLLLQAEFQAAFMSAKVVRSSTNMLPIHYIHRSPDEHLMLDMGYIDYSRCLFQYAFKLSDYLKEESDMALQKLYGTNPKPYAAWHWRSGGLVNEEVLARAATTHALGSSRLQQIMSALTCSDYMAARAGLQQVLDRPLLLITDHNLVRQWVADGHMKRMVTINATVVHIRSQTFSNEDFLQAWVDIVVLAHADCLIVSKSGYSAVAQWMGDGSAHVIHIDQCLKMDQPRFEDEPV